MGVYYGMNGLWVPIGGQGGAAPIDPNLLAENIKSGVTISGVTGTFTNDGTATASDIVKNKTAYINGEKVTGNVTTMNGNTICTYSTNTSVSEETDKIAITTPTLSNNILFRTGARIQVRSPKSNFGDATAADVASGKTFTSSAGLKVTGEGKLFESNYMGDTELVGEKDTSYVNLDFTNNIITIKPYNINSPTSRVTGVDNYAIRIRQSSSDYSETLVVKYMSTRGRYLHMEWRGASSPSNGSATINYGERGLVTETWDDTNKQISLEVGSLEYYKNTSYSVDIYITWEIMHI